MYVRIGARRDKRPKSLKLEGVGQPAKADWLCGADQCVWVTYNVVSVPAYAVACAPPTNPNCYWKQGIFGRWKYICP